VKRVIGSGLPSSGARLQSCESSNTSQNRVDETRPTRRVLMMAESSPAFTNSTVPAKSDLVVRLKNGPENIRTMFIFSMILIQPLY
jgi:hypothetical protein